MAGFFEHWSLCGGWAVDAWLGRVSREHGDVDVSVFVDDQRALFEHLRGWQLLAHRPAWEAGRGDEWWDGDLVLPPATHIHARPPAFTGPMPKDGIANAEDGFTIEFYLDERADDEWILWREPKIALPVRDSVRPSSWGMLIPAPEVLLFFKCQGEILRRRDRLDLLALLPHLTAEQRTWLREAVERAGHPWMKDLSSKRGAA
jgi:hypothetical protein